MLVPWPSSILGFRLRKHDLHFFVNSQNETNRWWPSDAKNFSPKQNQEEIQMQIHRFSVEICK
jgi:hypothetical protein